MLSCFNRIGCTTFASKSALIFITLFLLMTAPAFAQSNSIVVNTEIGGEVSKTRKISELLKAAEKDLLKVSLSFATGGASTVPSFGSLGFYEQACRTFGVSPSVMITGVYSAAPAISLDEIYDIWWGEKYPVCQLVDYVEWGDMVYFLAEGFGHGEKVDVKIEGPAGRRESIAEIREIYHAPDGGCSPRRTSARFGLVMSPILGVGTIRVTVSNGINQQTATLEVKAPRWPKYGLQTGNSLHPLLLEAGQNVHFAFAGFPPNGTTAVAIFHDKVSSSDLEYNAGDQGEGGHYSKAVGNFEVKMNDKGWAVFDLAWPDSYPPGFYSFTNFDAMDVTLRQAQHQGISPFRLGREPLSESELPTSLAAAYPTIQILARPDLTAGDNKVVAKHYSVEVVPKFHVADQTWRVTNVQSNDVLNVRDAPKGNKIGELHYLARDIRVGEKRDVAGSSPWVYISCAEFGPTSGWVNSRYLAPDAQN